MYKLSQQILKPIFDLSISV